MEVRGAEKEEGEGEGGSQEDWVASVLVRLVERGVVLMLVGVWVEMLLGVAIDDGVADDEDAIAELVLDDRDEDVWMAVDLLLEERELVEREVVDLTVVEVVLVEVEVLRDVVLVDEKILQDTVDGSGKVCVQLVLVKLAKDDVEMIGVGVGVGTVDDGVKLVDFAKVDDELTMVVELSHGTL